MSENEAGTMETPKETAKLLNFGNGHQLRADSNSGSDQK